jgi:hypothetical protein
MKNSRLPRWLLLAGPLLLALAAGCGPQNITSPYQAARDQYYRALSRGDALALNIALVKAEQVVEQNPGDLESRTLLADIYLTRTRADGGETVAADRAALVRNLQVLFDAGNRPDAAQGWVLPHAHVQMADLLSSEAGRVLVDRSSPAVAQGLTAQALYDASVAFAIHALALAKAGGTPSVVAGQVAAHAASAYANALKGLLNSINRLDPGATNVMLQARRTAIITELDRVIRGEEPQGKAIPVITTSLDPADQKSARDINQLIADDLIAQVDQGQVQPEVLVRRQESALAHHVIVLVLTGAEPLAPSPQLDTLQAYYQRFVTGTAPAIRLPTTSSSE